MSDPDNIMTVKELAQYLKLAESTIYKLAQDGEIPGRKIGGTWRFYLDSINDWMGGKEFMQSGSNESAPRPDA